MATPTYKVWKEKEHLKKTPTPTLVDPAHCKLQGRVKRDGVVEETPASKKKKSKSEDTPKASKTKASKSNSSEDLKSLGEKWSQRFAHLEAIILAKSFAVPVALVQKTSSTVATSEKPFFNPVECSLYQSEDYQ